MRDRETRKMRSSLPKQRTENIIVQDVLDETLIYDLKRHKLNTLNPTVAYIWQQCDGQTVPEELTRRLQTKFPDLGEQAEHVLWAGLQRLEKNHLLAQKVSKRMPQGVITRRNMLLRLGVSAALLPVIMASSPPPASAQASCLPEGSACNVLNDQCCAPYQCVPGSNRCIQ